MLVVFLVRSGDFPDTPSASDAARQHGGTTKVVTTICYIEKQFATEITETSVDKGFFSSSVHSAADKERAYDH